MFLIQYDKNKSCRLPWPSSVVLPTNPIKSLDDSSLDYLTNIIFFQRVLLKTCSTVSHWFDDSNLDVNKEFGSWGLYFTEETKVLKDVEHSNYINKKNVITKLSHEVKTPCISISNLIESILLEKDLTKVI